MPLWRELRPWMTYGSERGFKVAHVPTLPWPRGRNVITKALTRVYVVGARETGMDAYKRYYLNSGFAFPFRQQTLMTQTRRKLSMRCRRQPGSLQQVAFENKALSLARDRFQEICSREEKTEKKQGCQLYKVMKLASPYCASISCQTRYNWKEKGKKKYLTSLDLSRSEYLDQATQLNEWMNAWDEGRNKDNYFTCMCHSYSRTILPGVHIR